MFRRSLTLIPHAVSASARPGRLLTSPRAFHAVSNSTTECPPSRTVTRRAESEKRRPPRVTARPKTFHPARLHSSDFLDFSNRRRPRVILDGDGVTLRYGARKHRGGPIDDFPFPPNARGFLYYHHDPNLPLTTGEIRFRVTPDSDVAGFESGEDLVGPYGSPWAMSLVTLSKPSLGPVRRRLLDDGLFDASLMRRLQEHWERKRVHQLQKPIHYLEQAFPAHLSRGFYLRIVTPEGIGRAYSKAIFVDNRAWVKAAPYSARLLLRLERSTLPEHAGTRTVVIRVLEILEPIEVVVPGYDMRLPVPKEGELLMRRQKFPGGPRPCSIDLDKAPAMVKDIGLLYPQHA